MIVPNLWCQGGGDVLHQLRNVLGRNLGRHLELQDRRVVNFEVDAPDQYRHGPRHCEALDFLEAGNAVMIEKNLEHPVIKSLCLARLVLIHHVLAAPCHKVHRAACGARGRKGH